MRRPPTGLGSLSHEENKAEEEYVSLTSRALAIHIFMVGVVSFPSLAVAGSDDCPLWYKIVVLRVSIDHIRNITSRLFRVQL